MAFPPLIAGLGAEWVMKGDSRVPQRGWAGLRIGAGFAVVSMGILALAGWVTGLRLLAEIRADFIPMAPNTAIGFILLGCAGGEPG